MNPPTQYEFTFCGRGLSLSQDRVVFGCPSEPSGLSSSSTPPVYDGTSSPFSDSGSVFSYKLNTVSGQYEFEYYLRPSTIRPSQQFGSALSVSDDLLVVGAPFDSNQCTGINDFSTVTSTSSVEAGSAYIFRLTAGGVWQEEAWVCGEDAFNGFSRVGTGVEIDSATGLAFVSQPRGFKNKVNVYQTTAGSGTWSFVESFSPAVIDGGAEFGSALSYDSGVILVGALFNTVNTFQEGSAHVFQLNPIIGSWEEKVTLTSRSPSNFDRFGKSVVYDSVDGTVVVGAPLEDSGSNSPIPNEDEPDAGAVFTFECILKVNFYDKDADVSEFSCICHCRAPFCIVHFHGKRGTRKQSHHRIVESERR